MLTSLFIVDYCKIYCQTTKDAKLIMLSILLFIGMTTSQAFNYPSTNVKIVISLISFHTCKGICNGNKDWTSLPIKKWRAN